MLAVAASRDSMIAMPPGSGPDQPGLMRHYHHTQYQTHTRRR